MSELDYVSQGREIAQLEIFIAWNVVRSSYGGKHLRLFNGVDTEVRFEIKIQVQHVFRIAGLLGDDLQDLLLDGILRGRWGGGWGRGDCKWRSDSWWRRGCERLS